MGNEQLWLFDLLDEAQNSNVSFSPQLWSVEDMVVIG